MRDIHVLKGSYGTIMITNDYILILFDMVLLFRNITSDSNLYLKNNNAVCWKDLPI